MVVVLTNTAVVINLLENLSKVTTFMFTVEAVRLKEQSVQGESLALPELLRLLWFPEKY